MPTNSTIKRKMIREGKWPAACSECGLGETWNGKPLTLQLHHIDGDKANQDISNIQVLCPNCHTQTENFGNVKNVNKPLPKCKRCGEPVNRRVSKYCSTRCKDLDQVTWDDKTVEKLIESVKTIGYSQTDKLYNLPVDKSRTVIKRYIKRHNLDLKTGDLSPLKEFGK